MPASLTDVSPRVGRTYIDEPPAESGLATNAIVWPSGERAKSASLKPANLRQYPPIIADEARNYFASRWGNKSGTADIHHTFADLIIKTGSAALMASAVRCR